MKEELELELVKKYPKILKDYRGDMMQTCMAWGMECGDGWYNLLEECFKKLQYFCDLASKDGKEVQVIADQIKEKYGTLRFYYHVTGDATNTECDIIDDIVTEADRKSKYTCEETGEDGTVCHQGSWLKTLCYKEARKQGYKACDEGMEAYWQEKDKKNDSNNQNN